VEKEPGEARGAKASVVNFPIIKNMLGGKKGCGDWVTKRAEGGDSERINSCVGLEKKGKRS